jgi:hypothetical protein
MAIGFLAGLGARAFGNAALGGAAKRAASSLDRVLKGKTPSTGAKPRLRDRDSSLGDMGNVPPPLRGPRARGDDPRVGSLRVRESAGAGSRGAGVQQAGSSLRSLGGKAGKALGVATAVGVPASIMFSGGDDPVDEPATDAGGDSGGAMANEQDETPFYSGINRVATGRVDSPIGRTDNGTQIFQDSPNSFSDRGRPPSLRSDPDQNRVDMLARYDEIGRRNRELQDAREAASMGITTEAWQAEKLARNARDMRGAMGEQGFQQFVSQGGLRGLPGGSGELGAMAGVTGAGAMDAGDMIRYADLQRSLGKDAFDQQVKGLELGLRGEQLATNQQLARLQEQREANDVLANAATDLISDDEQTRQLASGRVLQMIRDDPNSPQVRALIGGLLGGGTTGMIDRGLRLGGEAPRPIDPTDFAQNYFMDGNAVQRRDALTVDRDFNPDVARILDYYWSMVQSDGSR